MICSFSSPPHRGVTPCSGAILIPPARAMANRGCRDVLLTPRKQNAWSSVTTSSSYRRPRRRAAQPLSSRHHQDPAPRDGAGRPEPRQRRLRRLGSFGPDVRRLVDRVVSRGLSDEWMTAQSRSIVSTGGRITSISAGTTLSIRCRTAQSWPRANISVEREPTVPASSSLITWNWRNSEWGQCRMTPVVVQTFVGSAARSPGRCDGATRLDRELVADAPVTARDGGLGRDVRDALARQPCPARTFDYYGGNLPFALVRARCI